MIEKEVIHINTNALKKYPNDIYAQRIYAEGFRDGLEENNRMLLQLLRIADYTRKDYEILLGKQISFE